MSDATVDDGVGSSSLHSPRRPDLVSGVLGAAACATIGLTVARTVGNSPAADALAPYEAVVPGTALVLVGLATAAVAVGATAEEPAAIAGLAFVGGFALLSLVAPARAGLPAAAGVLAGGTVAAAAASIRRSRDGIGRPVVVAVLLAGVATALAGAAGLAPALLQPLGASALFAGLCLAPLLTGVDRVGAALGVGAAGAVLVVGTTAPYVLGGMLVGGLGALGVPTLLVALGVGGAVAAGATAVARRSPDRAAGVGLVLFAGVPASVPAAAAAVLGIAVLAGVTEA